MAAASVIAGFTIGAIGSFHCVGMCGPLALSLPVSRYQGFQRFIAIALYNLGRVCTYTLLGLLFGAVGQSVAMAGFQQAMSVIIGALLIISVLFGRRLQAHIPLLTMYNNLLKRALGGLLVQRPSVYILLVTGMVNGLLPCGLVYVGLASAIAAGSALQGAVVMLFFGLGTVPLMFLLMIAGTYFTPAIRHHMRRAVPYVIIIMGCLLILRGMNLGIPYISPMLQSSATVK